MHIDRREYPELDLILWDDANDWVDPVSAFRAYETRWRFVSQKHLSDKEIKLITELTKIYSNGYMLI